MPESSAVAAQCPGCSGVLLHAPKAPSWCPQCEWGLGLPEPVTAERRLARWERQLAVRLTARDFDRLRGRKVGRPGPDLVRVAAAALAAAVHLVTIGLLAGGVWLVALDFPSIVGIALGCVMILGAVALRPRAGRLSPWPVVHREDAPGLTALIDEVAASVGARPPDIVQISVEMNASYGTVGLRRWRVLVIGAPLWMILSPQQRVALIAHELGHAVNGDLRRGLVVGSALRSLAGWCEFLRPKHDSTGEVSLVGLAELALRCLLWTLHGFTWVVLWLLARLVFHSGQRSEYYADELSARVASSQGAVGLAQVLLVARTCQFLMESASRRGEGPAGLVAACAGRLSLPPTELERRRRVTLHTEAGMFASHPPTGLRIALLESRPPQDPIVTLEPEASARIDEELGEHYARVASEIGH